MDNNRPQFNNPKVEAFCEGYWSVYYPQANDLVEATNRVFVNNLKHNLEEMKENLLEEFSKVLCAQRTTQKEATGESHFSLVYGTKDGLPTLTFIVAEDVEEN